MACVACRPFSVIFNSEAAESSSQFSASGLWQLLQVDGGSVFVTDGNPRPHMARGSAGWTLLPDSEVGRRLCLFWLCRAAWRRAEQLNTAGVGQFGLNSCRHAETQPSLWMTLSDLHTSDGRVAGETEDEQKNLLPSRPLHCQMVLFFFTPLFSAYHFFVAVYWHA